MERRLNPRHSKKQVENEECRRLLIIQTFISTIINYVVLQKGEHPKLGDSIISLSIAVVASIVIDEVTRGLISRLKKNQPPKTFKVMVEKVCGYNPRRLGNRLYYYSRVYVNPLNRAFHKTKEMEYHVLHHYPIRSRKIKSSNSTNVFEFYTYLPREYTIFATSNKKERDSWTTKMMK